MVKKNMDTDRLVLLITNILSFGLFLLSEKLGRSKCRANAVWDLFVCAAEDNVQNVIRI